MTQRHGKKPSEGEKQLMRLRTRMQNAGVADPRDLSAPIPDDWQARIARAVALDAAAREKLLARLSEPERLALLDRVGNARHSTGPIACCFIDLDGQSCDAPVHRRSDGSRLRYCAAHSLRAYDFSRLVHTRHLVMPEAGVGA